MRTQDSIDISIVFENKISEEYRVLGTSRFHIIGFLGGVRAGNLPVECDRILMRRLNALARQILRSRQ